MGILDYPAAWFTVFALGAAVILGAGASLPSLGRAVARHMGVGETSVGLFGLAVITSLPELAVTLSAMRFGAADLALGNVLGSNNFNVAIIGVLSLLFGGRFFLRADLSRYSSTGLLLMVSTVITSLGIAFGRMVPGLLSLLIFSVPIAVLFFFESRTSGPGAEEAGRGTPPPVGGSLWGSVAAFTAMAALVVLAGVAVSWAAKRIAMHEFMTAGGALILGQTFVGTLLVAVATSLPEVTVAFSAMHRADSPDMAVGTLLGSNSFNVLVFAIGAPFAAMGPTRVVSAWSNLSEVNLLNVAIALLLTALVLSALRSARAGAAGRVSAALMIPIYAAGLFAVYKA